MSFFPVPDVMKDNIYELNPRFFNNRGIKLIILDIDNTIAPYSVPEPTERMKAWVQGLKDAGFKLAVLSNNRGTRPETYAGAFGLTFIGKAWKPFTKTAKQLIEEMGCSPENTAFIGDQIYTDCLCAKALGSLAIVVKPIEYTNFWLRFRHWLEFPFILKYKWKDMK
ncbi:MAG: YqeG family HAD IIIA-type phosphatase [Oscillospiraceae bacterium]|nr:YqeG family HAD IIIA-type phosphatase [Oscillospiraceae bacterium]